MVLGQIFFFNRGPPSSIVAVQLRLNERAFSCFSSSFLWSLILRNHTFQLVGAIFVFFILRPACRGAASGEVDEMSLEADEVALQLRRSPAKPVLRETMDDGDGNKFFSGTAALGIGYQQDSLFALSETWPVTKSTCHKKMTATGAQLHGSRHQTPTVSDPILLLLLHALHLLLRRIWTRGIRQHKRHTHMVQIHGRTKQRVLEETQAQPVGHIVCNQI